jgi:hypothetical protein
MGEYLEIFLGKNSLATLTISFKQTVTSILFTLKL